MSAKSEPNKPELDQIRAIVHYFLVGWIWTWASFGVNGLLLADIWPWYVPLVAQIWQAGVDIISLWAR